MIKYEKQGFQRMILIIVWIAKVNFFEFKPLNLNHGVWIREVVSSEFKCYILIRSDEDLMFKNQNV